MKVLMSLGIFYPSQIGGPGNTLYWMGKELARHKIDVTVVTSDAGVAEEFAPRDQWFDLDGIKIKYLRISNPNNSFAMAKACSKQIKESDIVMLSSLFYKPNFPVGLAALRKSKKIIWSPRGELLAPHNTLKRIYLKLVKHIFGKKVLFHATSAEEQKSIHRFFGQQAKSIVIPNYMELPTKIEVGNNKNYLLYVGRIMPIKALDKLIDGIAKSEMFLKSDFKLYLAGKNEGDYYEQLAKQIKQYGLQQKIIFKGMVVGDEKNKLYAGAKATLLVSNSENFGNVIIESLAQGTPAITSTGTPWQTLPEKGAGFWIDNSPETIAKTIDYLLSMTEEEYNKMRERAYELCCAEYNITTNINQWLNILTPNKYV